MSDIRYEVVRNIAVLSEPSRAGWVKELNIISWNGSQPKFDIREWGPNDKFSKGVTLTTEQMRKVKEALNQMDDL